MEHHGWVCVCGVFCILMNKERDHGQGLLPVMKQQIKNSTKGVCTVSVPLFQRVMHVMSSQKRAGGFNRAPGMEWRGRWNFVGAWALDRTMLIWTGSNCQWSCALHIPSWSRPPCCCRWWWKCDDLFYLTQISISSIWVSVIKPAWTIHTHLKLSPTHQHSVRLLLSSWWWWGAAFLSAANGAVCCISLVGPDHLVNAGDNANVMI